MEPKTTVYVGSLWHEYSDPFCCVVGVTPEKAQEALDAAAQDEEEFWREAAYAVTCPNGHGNPEEFEDGEDCVICKVCGEVVDSWEIMTGDIFAEPLDSLDLEPEQVAELEEDGYCYTGPY